MYEPSEGCVALPPLAMNVESWIVSYAQLLTPESTVWLTATPGALAAVLGNPTSSGLRSAVQPPPSFVMSQYTMIDVPCGLTLYGKKQQEMLDRIQFAADLDIDTVIFDCEANYTDFVASFLPPLVEAATKAGVRIAVENHLTVPFSADFESGGNEDQRWETDNAAQVLIAKIGKEVCDHFGGPEVKEKKKE